MINNNQGGPTESTAQQSHMVKAQIFTLLQVNTNMPAQISLQESDLIFLGHTEVGLLDHMGAVFTMF